MKYLQLRHKYELSHQSTTYKPWIIQGSVIDLIMPPDLSQIFVVSLTIKNAKDLNWKERKSLNFILK